MIRADTTAPVVNDEEKRARVTTQVHKVGREGDRFDVGGSAFGAGCDRETTLGAGARHSGTSSARNLPAEPQAIRAKLRGAVSVKAGAAYPSSRPPPTSVAWGAAQLAWKWRYVAQLPGLLVHAPDVAATATVVVNATAFAQGRQEPDPLTVARWTRRNRGHGWGNSHHPLGTVSALLGNSRTQRACGKSAGAEAMRSRRHCHVSAERLTLRCVPVATSDSRGCRSAAVVCWRCARSYR